MAKSKARKKRDHAQRNGKNDPNIKRGSWNGINPITKTTPTKRGLLDRLRRKEAFDGNE